MGQGLFLFCSLADVLWGRASGTVDEDAGLSHESLSVGFGDEVWGWVHVVLGRKDSSLLGRQGVVGQVDSLQQGRRAVMVLASAVAAQPQARARRVGTQPG